MRAFGLVSGGAKKVERKRRLAIRPKNLTNQDLFRGEVGENGAMFFN